MKIYSPGQRVIAQVTWDGISKQRNCKLVEETLPGFWTVNVWSNWTQTFYTNTIEIAETDIMPLSPLISWGPRRHKPFVPDP
jgi:hypothetical protein